MAEAVSGLRALKAITFLATAPAILDVARLFEDVEITFGSEHVLSRELAALEQATTAAGYRFTDALVGTQRHFLEDGLILRTERGDLVRSKSELVIADKLFARGIDYVYEQPLELEGGRIRYPDFTITDHARGVTFYREHLGLLDDPRDRARWQRKREGYREARILSWEAGGGEDGTLIETQDEPGGTLEAALG